MILLLNFCYQISRNSADNMIKISSYTDFIFDIDSWLIYEQEKKYYFLIFFLKKYLIIEDYKILLVLVSRCSLLFLI